jgi:hypothetical protein
MPNPTPIYQVEFDDQLLPGYVQSDSRPLSFKRVISNPIGRDGGRSNNSGADLRELTLDFRVLTRLDNNTSGIQHLEDCMDQYREALAILTRTYEPAELRIHDTDRYYVVSVDNISAPMVAGENRRLTYSVKFTAQPWAYGGTLAEGTFSGNGTLTVSGLDNSRRTYPTLTVAGTVTAFNAEDDNGKLVEFVRGSFSGTITINCSNMVVTTASGNNAVSTLTTLNYGLYYTPNVDGEFDLTVTGYTGSGNVNVYLRPRYEL